MNGIDVASAKAQLSVLLVEDHAIVRQGILALLSFDGDVNVVGEAADGVTAIALARTLQPDVVVMDIGLPDVDGVTATREIVALEKPPRVLALSAFSDRHHVLAALRAGANGYLIKDCVTENLREAIRTVARGGRYLSPSIASLILDDLHSARTSQDANGLTHREREVLQLLADGNAMKEAAQKLDISTKTVETHRRAIMQKLKLFSVAELTKHAIREGIVTLD